MADEWKKIEIGNSWNFEEAPELVGLYTGKEENLGENNSTLYTFEISDNNEVVSVWGSTVLDGRMKSIKVGEEVKIVYKGKKDSLKRKGKFFHDFEVFHREVDFAAV